jgi:hypothetical protein
VSWRLGLAPAVIATAQLMAVFGGEQRTCPHRSMRRSRIACPSRIARDEHRPLAGAPAADPGPLAGALK